MGAVTLNWGYSSFENKNRCPHQASDISQLSQMSEDITSHLFLSSKDGPKYGERGLSSLPVHMQEKVGGTLAPPGCRGLDEDGPACCDGLFPPQLPLHPCSLTVCLHRFRLLPIKV